VLGRRRRHRERLALLYGPPAVELRRDVLVDPLELARDEGAGIGFFGEGRLGARERKVRVEGAGDGKPGGVIGECWDRGGGGG